MRLKNNKLWQLLTKIPFYSKTTMLVWIVAAGFVLISIVSLFAFMGLKQEFDFSVNQSKDIQTLTLLDKQYQNKIYDKNEILHLWEQYQSSQMHSPKNVGVLRHWYAKVFLPLQSKEMANLYAKENELTKQIAKVFNENQTESILELIDNKISLNVQIAQIDKLITDSLYYHTLIVLIIFMVAILGIIMILSLGIKASINDNHSLLESMINKKTAELQELNNTLQESIKHEVEQNRQKDLIMNQQMRLASMGEMIQNIAHQWRQPLNSLMLLIQSFKTKHKQGKLTDEFINNQTEYGMKIAQNMSNTIENFRSFFLPEKEKEVFSLITAVQDCLELLQTQLNEHNIQTQIIYNKQDSDDLCMLGYQNSFIQVMIILINNAIDAIISCITNSAESSATHSYKIQITLEKIDYNAKICVKDNAGGIKLDDMTKIFEPYFTTKHKSVGTGIGLYMAKQIIERHSNGAIFVNNCEHSDGKRGAEFTLQIPLHRQ